MLVLGGPNTGKSTYRAQVFQRLDHQPGELRLIKSVGDLSAIASDVERLVQGLQPEHTHLGTYHSTPFSVADRSSNQFVLEFADYDGEQIRRMIDSNMMPLAWIERVQSADSWLLFLRIDTIRSIKSFMTDPVAVGPRTEAKQDSVAEASSELGAIEMLQRMLFVRNASLRSPLILPRLAVLLSCWDELPQNERSMAPRELLSSRAPLLAQFLIATWRADNLQVWGLSSTEQPLHESEENEDFKRRGPEHFGYIVVGENKIERDLTLPLSRLLLPQ